MLTTLTNDDSKDAVELYHAVLDEMERNMPLQLAVAKKKAYFHKKVFDAYLAEGFCPEHAVLLTIETQPLIITKEIP